MRSHHAPNVGAVVVTRSLSDRHGRKVRELLTAYRSGFELLVATPIKYPLTPRADMAEASDQVRYGPKAVVHHPWRNVCSGQGTDQSVLSVSYYSIAAFIGESAGQLATQCENRGDPR